MKIPAELGRFKDKNISRYVRLDSNFQMGGGGGGVKRKNPSMRLCVVPIIGTTHSLIHTWCGIETNVMKVSFEKSVVFLKTFLKIMFT